MRRWVRLGILLLVAVAAWIPAWAGDLVIYDNASENGFNPGCSFPPADSALWNFSENTVVHGASGTAVSFAPADFAAISWCTPGSLSTTNYSGMTFWVNGGASGGQNLELVIGNGGNTVASALLATLLGQGIAANTWTQITVSFGAAPMAFNGTFDQISIQDYSGNAVGNPQPTVYFDDVSLLAPPPADDLIFDGDFENRSLPPPLCGMRDDYVTVTPAPGDPMVSDQFSWCDSAGKPRVAVLAHNDQTGKQVPGGYVNHGGSLQQFSYQMPNNSTRTATVTTYGNGGYGGFGYVVSHPRGLTCSGDDSALGYSFTGTWTQVFTGRHHAIFRFQQNYQVHCGPNPNPPTTFIPVTIDWIFSTGRDNPLWAITYDLSAATKSDLTALTADFLNNDSRAPYGELTIDGPGFTDIDGVAWGDKYKFTSTTTPVTLSSAWTWNAANTIPYVKEWIVSTDATMGLVQTQTIDQQDAGGARTSGVYPDVTALWTKTSSANGDACTTPQPGQFPAATMPCQNNWPYQANNDSIGVGVSNNNARLTWGTQYGFLGQTTYASDLNAGNPNHGPNLPGWPKKSYSVYVVLGPHSTSPVETQVTQAETAQTLILSATIGSVVGSGPAGVNRADTVNYAPAGYNHVYGALAFAASVGNQLDAYVTVGSGTLQKPLLILNNYGGGYPTVKLNGTTLGVDVDYFPSLRAGANELWITFNRDLTGANHIQITP